VSRKSLIFSLLLLALAVAVGTWVFWAKLLWAFNGFQTLDKDQLELWEKRRDLVWPVLVAVGLGIWGLVRLLWTQAATDEKTATTQRAAELAYLKNLRREYELPEVEDAYTSQEGDIRQHEHLPERWFKAQLRYDRHKAADNPHEANTPAEHHDDLLKAFAKHPWLVLLGEPGMGKTFSLWRIAAEYAGHAVKDARKPLPVIIPLNEWIDKDQTLEAFVSQQMQGLAPFYAPLRDNMRLLPLLDALNEIPFDQRDQKLEQVKEWVRKKHDYPGLLLTCRLRDYTLELVQDLDRLTIEPLTPPRIHDFLHNYFRHVFRKGQEAGKTADRLFWQLTGGEAMQQAWQRWQVHKPAWKIRLRHWFERDYTQPTWENFWKPEQPQGWYWEHGYYWDGGRLEHLNNPRSLLKLAENPYLLTMIAKIFHQEGQLPDSKRSLFEHFVGVLLDREQRDKNRQQEDIPPRRQLEDKLKELAWELQSQGSGMDEARTTLLRSEAEQVVPAAWLKFSHAANLLEIIGDKVRFSHQLLQEFFTAQSFKERREQGWKASQIWSESGWKANGWEVATELALEYELDLKPFLHWLAEGNPKLAAKIAREQHLLDGGLFAEFRAQWQNAITDIEHYPNPHERHAISTVLAWLDWDNRPHIGVTADGLPDIDWVEIPAGEFIFSEEGELGRQTLHLETYRMNRYPVTNAQFHAFVVADDGYGNDDWWQDLQKPETPHESYWKESNRPVEQVDWYEAMAFSRWLSKKMDLDIRLPTEEQWEKAARGTDGREYPWEGSYKIGYANIDEAARYGVGEKVGEYFLGETSAVGIYPQGKSPYGLMDMSGNVWEWCLNKYEEPQITTADVSGGVRVVRGGAWDYYSGDCRSSFRFDRRPHYRLSYQGFRLVVVLSPH
jgi:formylglycine-generating enzyme required for sulfatase activity